MNSAFDSTFLSRIEDAGLNASAAREQRWVDGWLVRFSPGKAKRARCIQAVAAGRLSVEAKLALCLPVFAEAGLHPFIRITPFSQPPGLDEQLARLGLERVDDTRVMVLRELAERTPSDDNAFIEASDSEAFVAWIGRLRGSSEGERRAHAERIAHAPVAHRAALLRNAAGAVVAGGQVVTEGELAGLYDVFTAEAERGRGHARALCVHLLQRAVATGSRVAYLQVDAANDAARRVYRSLGFVDAYSYHYRSPPAPT